MLRVVSVALVLTALWSAEAAVKGALNPSVAVVQQKAQTHVPPPPADPAPPPAGAEQLKTPPLTAPKAYAGVLKGRDRYARYCLNMFAPQELGLPDIYPEHDAFCKHFATERSTVSLSEELRAAAKTPEPSQRESYIAELTAEAQAHGAGSSSSSSASASAASTAASSVSSGSAPSASSAPAQPSAHGASNGAQEFNADANGGRPLSLLEVGSNPASAAAKWPSRKIPYFVEDGLPDAVLIRLNWALNTFELRSCIVFVPTNKEKPWLPTEDPSLPAHRFRAVKSQDGSCSSATGMKTSGDQALHLGPKCNSGSILHALMHLLGFKHTVQRTDRDSYILWNELNTKPAFRKLYAKTNTPFKDYGRYDFSSIMHLGDGVQTLGDVDTAAAKGEAASFSVLSDPNKPNLAPKQPPTAGSSPALNAPWDGRAQRLFLSKGDVEGIHALYCPELPIPPSQLNEQALLHPKGVVLPKPSPTNKHPHLEPVECFHQAGDHDLYVQGKGDCVRHNFFWMCSPHPDCHNAKQTCGCGPSPKLGCDGQCFCQSNRWFNECRCMKPLDPKKQYCVNGSSPTGLAKALF